MRGILITFEGGDGAGKSTLLQGLYHHLLEKGESVLQTRAPGGTDLGNKIRSLLLHEKDPVDPRAELFLFLADRAQHVQEVILPALALGQIILCDRFNDSTVAYQGIARGLDPDQVRSLCNFATDNLNPNLTFYLDIDPKIGLQRTIQKSGNKDRMESETLQFHQKIRSAFHEMALKEPDRIRMLNGACSPEKILKDALEIFNGFFLSNRQ